MRSASTSEKVEEDQVMLETPRPIGGCPLMFLQPVDVAHRCMGWWLLRRGRIGEGTHWLADGGVA
jgi:hypothetical protein